MRSGSPGARPPRRRSPFWRYTAFQVPGWLLAAGGGWWLATAFDAPAWTAAALPAAWFVKDMALYPMLRWAYEVDDTPPIARLVGRVGTAVGRLDPRGWVRVRGELWRAVADADGAVVEPDAPVEVIGAAGMTLRVRPRGAARPSPGAAPAGAADAQDGGGSGGKPSRAMPGMTRSALP